MKIELDNHHIGGIILIILVLIGFNYLALQIIYDRAKIPNLAVIEENRRLDTENAMLKIFLMENLDCTNQALNAAYRADRACALCESFLWDCSMKLEGKQ